MNNMKNLLVELLVEELPPKALRSLGESFAKVLAASLKTQGLAAADAVVTEYASPRRLGVHLTQVASQAPDRQVSVKLMPVAVGLDASGAPTPALLKKLAAQGAEASAFKQLRRAIDGKAEALYLDNTVAGATLAEGLQISLDETLSKLPIPKAMTYQLERDCELPGWSSVSFVRPAHGLLALHGSDIVPLRALGLRSSNCTLGHRFEASVSPVVISDADSYEDTLHTQGAVIASYAARRADIVKQLQAAAQRIGDGVHVIADEALLDEVTALVERPNVLVCAFDQQFLAVPPECLVLTMKANQKYFPLVDANDKLTHQFLVVSNISPIDTSAVVGGNERVVRPRLADAKFFFDQDRKRTLESRVEGLAQVVYHNKLGTQGERSVRVAAIVQQIAQQLGGPVLAASAVQAARLAKTDLLTDMVGEFPELQGIMGGYYARHDGLSEEVALGIEDHYKPRFAGDDLPRNATGLVVALADKLETLVGMFGIGNLPTGDKDPFALRRHALGFLRMLAERDLALDLDWVIAQAVPVFGNLIADASAALTEFLYDRFAGSLREQGYSAKEVDAVLTLRPQRLGDVPHRLLAVRAFAALPESTALAAANKRIGNILKKTDDVDAHVSEVLLQERAEKLLYASMQQVLPQAHAQWQRGDYTASLQSLAALREPVDAFFADVMVNAEALDLRLNRLGLLKQLHDAMNRVADLSKLAT
jgi:glycyl-tRNA synthetase beta chain